MQIMNIKNIWSRKLSLTWKIIICFLLLSSCLTLFATGFQIYRDYQQDVALVNSQIKVIEQSYLDSLSRSLWEVNEEQIKLQLKGILNLSDIQFVALQENTNQLSFSMGTNNNKTIISHTLPLEYSLSESETVHLGELTVVATLDNVRHRLRDKIFLILTTQAMKTFFASFCFFGIVYFLLTRHLSTITQYLRAMGESSTIVPLKLDRKIPIKSHHRNDTVDPHLPKSDSDPQEDELDQVVSAINSMKTSINKKVEELRMSEDQYRAVVENIGDYIARYDRSGRFIYANSSALEALGLPADKCIGKTHKEMGFSEYLCELWDENFESVFTTGIQKKIEFDTVLANGLMTLELQLNPEFSEDGAVRSVVGISRDITKRKAIEKQLRDSLLKLDEAVKAGRIGLWSLDLKTNEVTFSTEWKRQIGYEDHEIKDDFTEWENRIHPADLDSTLAKIKKGIKEIDQKYRVEFRFRHKDGSYRWIVAQASFILDDEGEATKMLGSHIDITEQKQLEAELHQAQKMESIGTLAGGIAHDFNNILSSVIGFTELALDSVEKQTPIEANLQEVYAAGLRAKDLVKQILTFARQSDEPLKPIQVDLIIKEVLKFIRSSLPATIEIKQNINSQSLIMASATQLHRIMMNLCTNAAHAMQDEVGTLEITLKDISITSTNREQLQLKPGNYIEIKVSDTGYGIAPDDIKKIFEPYFTTKGAGEGTGMGLAMVHGIVENYHGKILVDSTPGEGTVFRIYLPIARESKIYQQYKANNLPTGQERILFVDDEAQIAKMGSRLLGQLGYSVTTKTSSVDAYELFKSKPDDFDLVISDITMPQMTGDELAIKVMQLRPDIPVILCTGYSKRISEANSTDIGIKAFAFKPIIREDLAQKVHKVLKEAKVKP